MNEFQNTLRIIRNFVIRFNVTNDSNGSMKLRCLEEIQELMENQIYWSKWHFISENDLPSGKIRVLIQMSNGWQHVAFYEDDKWFLPREDEPLEENEFYEVIAWTKLPKFEFDWSDEYD